MLPTIGALLLLAAPVKAAMPSFTATGWFPSPLWTRSTDNRPLAPPLSASGNEGAA